MYLYNYVFIITSFVIIFSAKSIPHQAVSPPQSYAGRDLRPYYNYNLMHASTTFRPYDESYTKRRRNKNNPTKTYQVVSYHNIQYAPLPLNHKEHQLNQHRIPQEDDKAVEISTEANTHGSKYEIDFQRNKQKFLVPHLHSTESSDIAPRKYIPGYNIEMQAINNKLTQNGFYAPNANMLVKNKQVNVNLLQPQVIYRTQGIPQNIDNTKPPFSMIHYEFPEYIKTYDVNIATSENNEERPFFYLKASKVQLNNARARKVARAYRKASVNLKSSFRRFPSYLKEFFSDQKILQPSKTESDSINTRMIPRTV